LTERSADTPQESSAQTATAISELTFSDSQRSQQNSGVTGTLDKYSLEVLSHQDAEGAVRVAAAAFADGRV
jgi:hypothetical protein